MNFYEKFYNAVMSLSIIIAMISLHYSSYWERKKAYFLSRNIKLVLRRISMENSLR